MASKQKPQAARSVGSSSARSALSRRRFLNGSVSLLAASSFLSMAGSQASRADTPKRGGTLKLGLNGGSANDSLNPTRLLGTFSVNLSRQVYNTLVEIDDGGKAHPELAESWEASKDNAAWTFRLRQGVEFHNGKTLTAADVVYSLMMHIDPNSSSGAKGIVKEIKDVTAVDPATVRLTLAGPNADLPYLLSDFHLAIIPDGMTDFSRPVGTGGYQVTAFTPGTSATCNRNAHYWRSDRAFVDSVTSLVVNDDMARINALQSGELDVISQVDCRLAQLITANPDLALMVTKGRQHYSLPMDCRTAPFNDVNLRLALKYAIDRQAVIATTLAGYGTLGNDQPISPSDPFFNPALAQRPYDLDKARFYLKKAGLGNVTLQLHTATAAFAQAVDLVTMYREHAKAAGIDIDIVREPNDGYWKEVWMKKPWCASFWTGRPIADMMFSTVYRTDAPWNETHWSNDRFDKLLVEARGSNDTEKRKQIYGDLQAMVSDEGGALIPVFADYIDARRSNVQGFVPNPNHMLSDHRIAERVWLA